MTIPLVAMSSTSRYLFSRQIYQAALHSESVMVNTITCRALLSKVHRNSIIAIICLQGKHNCRNWCAMQD